MPAYFLSISLFSFCISLYLSFSSLNSITVYFIFTFPDSLFLANLVLLTDILHFFCVLLHYFIFCCSFTFQIEPSLTISTLYPYLNVFVTLHAVFPFYILLLFLDIMIFCFIFIIVWLFSSVNLYTSITILSFFFFFLSLCISCQCFSF